MDGLLPLNELKEFIHLHEKGQGYGGMLDNDVGNSMRILLERQLSREAPSIRLETQGFCSMQSTESVASTGVQSFLREGSRAVETESIDGPTSIQSHRQEGSTAIEDVPAPGLRKRGERSTECYETVLTMISMQIPEQALIKDPIHRSSAPVNNRCVEQGAPNGLPLRRYFPLQNLRDSVKPPQTSFEGVTPEQPKE